LPDITAWLVAAIADSATTIVTAFAVADDAALTADMPCCILAPADVTEEVADIDSSPPRIAMPAPAVDDAAAIADPVCNIACGSACVVEVTAIAAESSRTAWPELDVDAAADITQLASFTNPAVADTADVAAITDAPSSRLAVEYAACPYLYTP